ncbi:MAG: ACP S-malonyltransferase [Candidatus Promineifilaceae bacterium]|jgi:[acyl-carrier-protein] S-malonyltransferase
MSVALLFPGQGSQHVGMGKDLYDAEPAARAVFDQADQELGFSLSSLCFNGPEEDLTDTLNQQPALYTTSIAAWRVAQEKGWAAPSFTAGHSLGEFSALAAAGSLPFSDGLKLVRRRAELMKKAGDLQPGAMAAILALDVELVAGICRRAQEETGQPVQVANDNCPGQVVISGSSAALESAAEIARESGARKVVILPITIAAHSALMASSSDEFADAVDAVHFKKSTIPVIGNVSAAPLDSPEAIRRELKSQLTSPVQWTQSMRFLLDEGADTFVETGPGTVLLGLMKRIDRGAKRIDLLDVIGEG